MISYPFDFALYAMRHALCCSPVGENLRLNHESLVGKYLKKTPKFSVDISIRSTVHNVTP